jgi:hypothetical protein
MLALRTPIRSVRQARHLHPGGEGHLPASRESGAVMKRGETDAAPLRCVARVEAGVRRTLGVVVGQRERPVEYRDAVGAVADHLAGGRGLPIGEQVAAP